MKKSALSLFICAAISFSAAAETLVQNELAQDNATYTAIVLKLKPTTGLLKATNNKITLSDASLTTTNMFRPTNLRSSTQSSELTELNKRYGFDRYLRIELPKDKSQDKTYINHIITELEQNQNVEFVYPEAEPISLDDTALTPQLKSSLNDNLTSAAVPDLRNKQDYLKAPDIKRTGYYMGGVNRDSVNHYAGSAGEGVTIISTEIDAWNTSHVNLPPMSLSSGKTTYVEKHDHDTASVGIMAAKDMGTGIRGLAWKSRMGYAASASNNLYNLIPQLKAGDVVQIGIQVAGGYPAGCQKDCWVAMESQTAYYDIIKALTDKGVHVIEAAGNGNINMDSPGFQGRFDAHVQDSGAILAGAFCAKDGKKASFSSYGSRITSSAWGCWDVVTTGYGDLYKNAGVNDSYTATFAGTSSANPIIAGVVASLSGIAKANGITVTPRQMRQILAETGTPLANGDSAKVGTQPDMERAVARIMALKDGNTPVAPAPTAAAGADYTMVSPTTGVSTYPLDGSKSLNAKSYNWSVTKGAETFSLEANLNGTLVKSVDSAHAYAVIPANSEGEAVFTLTTTGADGRTATDSMTIKVTKPAVPEKDDTPAKDDTPVKPAAPAYNAKIAYPTKCTKVSYNGKIWFNQWYVNPGQETPGTGGQWGAWREQGSSSNSCK
ncbi:serine protease [Enterobacter cloacae]|uniref:S8 family peptidase n=1 Tax=Enterobacter cloacae TaxID=550 RepID=UPI00307653E5